MPKYNIVYIFADQLRYDVPSYCGHTRSYAAGNVPVMPNLDALSHECVNFSQAVSSNPVCAPYRACLFTGKYTTGNGMIINEIRLNPHQRFLAQVLTENGYRSGYIGKWHLYSDQLRNFYVPQNSFTPVGEHRLGFDDYWAAYGFSHTYYGELAFWHENTPEKIYADGYMPDVQTDLLIKRMEEYAKTPDEPFALFLSYGTPHAPWNRQNLPPEYYDRFASEEYHFPVNYSPEDDPHGDIWAHLNKKDKSGRMFEWMRIYDGMSANVDDNIGRIVSAMERLGLLENTILVFTSDHGECFGAHGRRQKSVFYEEAARVPFLIRMPGGRYARECDACLNTVDIMPTLLELNGLPIPDSVDGVSLAGIITGNKTAEPPFAFLQGTGSVAVYTDGYEWRGLRDKQYTYAIWRRDGYEHLYDNIADPFQMNNLVDNPDYYKTLQKYRRLLEAKMVGINDRFETCGDMAEDWIYKRRVWRAAQGEFEPCPYKMPKEEDEPYYDGNRLASYPLRSTDTSYTVKDGTEIISDYTFYGAQNLKSVTLPSSLREIAHGAFSECPGLTEITIPEGVESIDANVFYRDHNLRRVTLPASVSKIVDSAFDDCPMLTVVVEPDSYALDFCRRTGLKYVLSDALQAQSDNK